MTRVTYLVHLVARELAQRIELMLCDCPHIGDLAPELWKAFVYVVHEDAVKRTRQILGAHLLCVWRVGRMLGEEVLLLGQRVANGNIVGDVL